MLTVINWLAGLLLAAGGFCAGLFMSKDAAGFPVAQMMLATIVLAFVVLTIVLWRSTFGNWRHRH